MKNKKMLFGAIILLFAITGICNIPNVSAQETIEIPPLSYAWAYIDTLEPKDWIQLDIDSDGAINVYIMNDEQFSMLQNSGGLIWTYCKIWNNIIHLHESFTITEDGSYYVVLFNYNLLFGRIVDVEIKHYYYSPAKPRNPFIGLHILIIFIIIIAGAIIIICRHEGKKEMIKPERLSEVREKQILKIRFCPVCGAEILGEARNFCSTCGTKINKFNLKIGGEK